MSSAVTAKELRRYVGYAEIEEATGMDKRQLHRLVAAQAPQPDGIPTNASSLPSPRSDARTAC